MTSDDARGPLPEGDQAGTPAPVAEHETVMTEEQPAAPESSAPEGPATGSGAIGTDGTTDDAGDVSLARRGRRRSRTTGGGSDGGDARRPALPLVPLLAVLLVLLLAAGAFLWFTRPEGSAIRTGDYAEALQAARSNVVDMTSFDHLTFDDDVRQIERVTTGDLTEETVAQLDERRQQILDAEAVVSTEVVGAGVTRADGDEATVLLVIQSTQRTADDPQAQVLRYRIEVEQKKVEGRWLLSAVRGG